MPPCRARGAASPREVGSLSPASGRLGAPHGGQGGESAAAPPAPSSPLPRLPGAPRGGGGGRAGSSEALASARLLTAGARGQRPQLARSPPPPLVTRAPGIKCTLSFKSITLINSGSAIFLNYAGKRSAAR